MFAQVCTLDSLLSIDLVIAVVQGIDDVHSSQEAQLRRTIAEDRTKPKTEKRKTKNQKIICGPTA